MTIYEITPCRCGRSDYVDCIDVGRQGVHGPAWQRGTLRLIVWPYALLLCVLAFVVGLLVGIVT